MFLLLPLLLAAPPASAHGPYRVELQRVTAVRDFATGRYATELALALRWTPPTVVVRAEGQPTIEAVEDDRGSAIAANVNRTKAPAAGNEFLCTVPLTGVPREARALKRVAGTFHVTAADRMLAFDFGELRPAPVRREEQGIVATVSRAEVVGNRLEVAVELLYPESTPEFESFESFTGENVAKFVGGPGGDWLPADSETIANGRRVATTYRFELSERAGRRWPGGGWRFALTTPGPLREVAVPWELRGVELP